MTERPLLSILIPSIPSRLMMLGALISNLQEQIGDLPAEILVLTDNKRRSIGEKRDALVQIANAQFLAFCDDDDLPLPGYVGELVTAIQAHPDVDVIVFNQRVSLNEKEFTVRFGLEYENEQANLKRNGKYPSVIKRKPFPACAWRADLAKKYRFEHLQDREDWLWVQQLLTEAKTQHRIEKTLHFYRFDDRITEAK